MLLLAKNPLFKEVIFFHNGPLCAIDQLLQAVVDFFFSIERANYKLFSLL